MAFSKGAPLACVGMRMAHTTLVALALALSLTACTDGLELEEDGDVSLAEAEQASYSGWSTIAAQYWSAQVRVCKTSTRINWQFINNTWWNVRTGGDAISTIDTYIEGVTSGSKYRTRAGITFWINFWSAGYGAAKSFDIASMPSC